MSRLHNGGRLRSAPKSGRLTGQALRWGISKIEALGLLNADKAYP